MIDVCENQTLQTLGFSKFPFNFTKERNVASMRIQLQVDANKMP